MPKMKSKGAVKKRFVVTKKGRVKCSRPARGHMHASKNAHRSVGIFGPLTKVRYRCIPWNEAVSVSSIEWQ